MQLQLRPYRVVKLSPVNRSCRIDLTQQEQALLQMLGCRLSVKDSLLFRRSSWKKFAINTEMTVEASCKLLKVLHPSSD